MSRSRGGLFAGLAALIVATIVIVGAGAASTPQRAKSKFTKHDRMLLAKKTRQGARTVSLLIATPRRGTGAVARNLRALGGKVLYRNNRLGYVRVSVPLRKADQASRMKGIQAINVDEVLPLPDPRPDGAIEPTPQPPPGAGTPRSNPYMPIRDTGAARFLDRHPSWDGRGVTVGIVDLGVDLDHPSLNTTSTGQRKIVDWVTYTHPSTDGDPTWRAFTSNVTVVDGTFTAFGRTYTGMSPDGTYRLARMREDLIGATSEYGIACSNGGTGSDLDRNGRCGDFFVMLWRASDNMVWTDSDNDGDMSDESPMTTYKVNHDIGHFGHDNPATQVRESVPFTVQPMTEPDPVTGFFFVNVGIVAGAHGSHVAGITAGNRLFGGQMSGAAPGAKIVSVRACLFVAGCTTHALIEGMIYVVETADVDVVNMSIGGLPALNDGNNTRAVLYNRLIDDNNTQMFFSAGNSGAGTNTIGDPAVATKAMAVGAYITKDTWRRNYGSDANFTDNLHPFSSRGPAEDGALKPQIVAPGAAISSVPTWQVGQPVVGTYTLPPGYGMFNGTSMAAPQAAGAAALLLSAAKARGVSHTAAQLRMAFNSTARFIPGYNASDQGNGLIDVERRMGSAPRRAAAGEHHVAGAGQHDPERLPRRAGLRPRHLRPRGRPQEPAVHRTYTFTRTSGPNGRRLTACAGSATTARSDTQRNLRLRQNDPEHVQRAGSRRGRAGFTRRSSTRQARRRTGSTTQTMNTVIVPDEFTAANGYLGDEDRDGRTEPRQAVLLPRACRQPGAQGRPDRAHPMSRARVRCASCASTRGASASTATPARRATCRLSPAVRRVIRSAAPSRMRPRACGRSRSRLAGRRTSPGRPSR